MGTWLEYPFDCAMDGVAKSSSASMSAVTPGTSQDSASKSVASGMSAL